MDHRSKWEIPNYKATRVQENSWHWDQQEFLTHDRKIITKGEFDILYHIKIKTLYSQNIPLAKWRVYSFPEKDLYPK